MLKFSKILLSLKRRFNSNLTSTILDERVGFFDKFADNWWDPQNGSMKQLHILQAPRISFICDQLKNKCATSGSHLLSGLDIVDVGCGAGLLSESLAMLGANVTGLDPSENSIKMAKAHAQSKNNIPGSLEYLRSTAEEHVNLRGEFYDAAVVCFILEHIQNRKVFIKSCLRLLKPNGSLIIMHVNRTIVFYFLTKWHIYITGIFPKNIINLKRALKKDELLDMVRRENCQLIRKSGVGFPWVGFNGYLTPSESHINVMHFTKK